MEFNGFSDEAFEFYEGLAADNSKPYWTAHKSTYDTAVRAPMAALLDALAPEFGADVSMFRPYRDTRFSKDKSPYKTNQGGFLAVADGVGYHLGLDATGLWIGGGFHAHDRDQTARYRAAIDDDTIGPALEAIVTDLTKDGFEIGGNQVRTRPRGVAPDHPRLDLMRREFLTAHRRVDPPDAATAAFATTLVEHWRTLTPLIEWATTHCAPR
jgi:uncharacterized protein (TIGR02453 family)